MIFKPSTRRSRWLVAAAGAGTPVTRSTRGIVAAQRRPAGLAGAQVNPRAAALDALLAFMALRLFESLKRNDMWTG